MCGVVGAVGPRASRVAYTMLAELQHRGEEACGLADVSKGRVFLAHHVGLVSGFEPMIGDSAVVIGHTRYSTTGDGGYDQTQPFYGQGGGSGMALGHNGNLTNHQELADEHKLDLPVGASDSRVVVELLSRVIEEIAPRHPDGALELALRLVVPQLKGAYSFVVMDSQHLIGIRDPNGFRPLYLAVLAGGGWALASELPAFRLLEVKSCQEIIPGQMVTITEKDGPRFRQLLQPGRPSFCVVEHVYFSRPDSRHGGVDVSTARLRMGMRLAEEAPVEADLVAGVPDSGMKAAEGFARASGIPLGLPFLKNRYVGRTFMNPDADVRKMKVRQKLSVLSSEVAGQRLVVVDDSIVRANTLPIVTELLREAGAIEIHLRIMLPPWVNPCYFGIDVAAETELFAPGKDINQMVKELGADSLAFLSLEGLLWAVGSEQGTGFCTACVSGDYPVDPPRLRTPANLAPSFDV